MYKLNDFNTLSMKTTFHQLATLVAISFFLCSALKAQSPLDVSGDGEYGFSGWSYPWTITGDNACPGTEITITFQSKPKQGEFGCSGCWSDVAVNNEAFVRGVAVQTRKYTLVPFSDFSLRVDNEELDGQTPPPLYMWGIGHKRDITSAVVNDAQSQTTLNFENSGYKIDHGCLSLERKVGGGSWQTVNSSLSGGQVTDDISGIDTYDGDVMVSYRLNHRGGVYSDEINKTLKKNFSLSSNRSFYSSCGECGNSLLLSGNVLPTYEGREVTWWSRRAIGGWRSEWSSIATTSVWSGGSGRTYLNFPRDQIHPFVNNTNVQFKYTVEGLSLDSKIQTVKMFYKDAVNCRSHIEVSNSLYQRNMSGTICPLQTVVSGEVCKGYADKPIQWERRRRGSTGPWTVMTGQTSNIGGSVAAEFDHSFAGLAGTISYDVRWRVLDCEDCTSPTVPSTPVVVSVSPELSNTNRLFPNWGYAPLVNGSCGSNFRFESTVCSSFQDYEVRWYLRAKGTSSWGSPVGTTNVGVNGAVSFDMPVTLPSDKYQETYEVKFDIFQAGSFVSSSNQVNLMVTGSNILNDNN